MTEPRIFDVTDTMRRLEAERVVKQSRTEQRPEVEVLPGDEQPLAFVPLERKPVSLRVKPTRITHYVRLTDEQFEEFIRVPLASYPWLDGLGGGSEEEFFGVLVFCPAGHSAVVNPEGGDYARYAARLS